MGVDVDEFMEENIEDAPQDILAAARTRLRDVLGDHDNPEDVKSAVDNQFNEQTRFQQLEADYLRDIEICRVDSSITAADVVEARIALAELEEEAAQELGDIVIPSSQSAREDQDGLLTAVKNILSNHPWIFTELAAGLFPEEVKTTVEGVQERCLAELQDVRTQIGNLRIGAIANARKQVIEQSQSSLQHLRQQVDGSLKKIQALEEYVATHREVIDKYQDATAKFEVQISALNSTNSDLQTRADNAEARSNDLEAEIASLKLSLDDARKEKGDLQGDLISAQRSNAASKEELGEAKGNLNALKSEKANLEGDLNRRKEELNDKNLEIGQLQSIVSARDDSLQNLNNEKSDLQGQLTSRKNEISELEESIKTRDSEILALKDSESTAKKEVEALQTEVDNHKGHLRSWENQKTESSKVQENLQDEKVNLEGELDKVKRQLTSTTSERQAATEKVDELEAEVGNKNREISRRGSLLGEAERRETEERSRADGLKSAFTAVLALNGNVDDIARLHQASASVEVSQGLETIMIPRVQVTTNPLREPTYSAAFDLWMSAQRGALDLECASSFLEQLVSNPSQIQGAFLPWIHDAVHIATAVFASRNADPPAWTFAMLKEAVVIMQLLAYIYNVSPQHQWEPSLKDIFSVISASATNFPRSIVFSEMHAQVQRLVERGQYMSSWIDFTRPITTTQLDSSNSLLASGNYLVLDATADALVFATGTPRTIHLLSHENIESLDEYGLSSILKLRSPVHSLLLEDQESCQSKSSNADHFASQLWFSGHWRTIKTVIRDGRILDYDELP